MTTTDDSQGFCLMDGSPLVDQLSTEPTIAMAYTDPTVTTQRPRKKKTGLWITLVVVGILVIGGVIGVLMYAAYRMGTDSASLKVNVNSNTSPTPKANSTGTLKATPQQTAPSSTPAQQATPESEPETQSSDEPTPIAWNTGPGFVKQETGLRYTFICPPDGTAGTVWGSDVYTADSSLCTAAVHAGKITLEKGGKVTIEFTGGRQTYGATTRNGITSLNFGEYPHSFVFK
jgi:hypothetical protein